MGLFSWFRNSETAGRFGMGVGSTKQFAFVGAVLVVLTGCQAAPPLMVWNKSGASASEFNTERYQCMQSSQHQYSSAYVSGSYVPGFGAGYSGSASSGQTTNQPLFNACMNAKGWSLQQDNKSQAMAEFKDADNYVARVCADPKYAPYYSKAPCKVNQITPEQMADAAKISPEAKAVFSDVTAQLTQAGSMYPDALRKYGGIIGVRRAELYQTTYLQYQQNNQNLYSGQITWGEYNKRRSQIAQEYLAADTSIRSSLQ